MIYEAYMEREGGRESVCMLCMPSSNSIPFFL